ncbi:MAG: N-acetylmuramoyl-L-alanine amidase [Lachnospiraceae bacterium]|nr:N-acetylmuramoyl-L-alanine amidase [Lachnospiraceae bacterium]
MKCSDLMKKAGAGFMVLCLCSLLSSMTVKAAGNPVVVIDPGHGGTNMGAQYNGCNEKDLTLQIANAMYQELSQYEGITVYMTRTADTELSLKERADYAKMAGADFLYSIHLNASNDHRLFGAEVWVPSVGNFYTRGYQFGTAVLEEFRGLGIFTKGIKTKLGTTGDEYYGILKNSRANGVNAVIIEHCYMDQGHDATYAYGAGALTALGKADATAVAKYYGLKSTALGKDYSGYQKVSVAVPNGVKAQDDTPPEYCNISFVSKDAGTGKAQIAVTTKDSQSPIIYYDYSANGGQNFSSLGSWLADTQGQITIPVNAYGSSQVVVRTYNSYYGFTQSNMITVP